MPQDSKHDPRHWSIDLPIPYFLACIYMIYHQCTHIHTTLYTWWWVNNYLWGCKCFSLLYPKTKIFFLNVKSTYQTNVNYKFILLITETLPPPQISITKWESCVLFLICICNPPGIIMVIPNQSSIILVVYHLQGAASCHGAFKPSSIYKWLPPYTMGSNLFTFMPNSPK